MKTTTLEKRNIFAFLEGWTDVLKIMHSAGQNGVDKKFAHVDALNIICLKNDQQTRDLVFESNAAIFFDYCWFVKGNDDILFHH